MRPLDFNKINFTLSKDSIIPEHRTRKIETCKRKLKQAEQLATSCGYVVDDMELPTQFTWTIEDVMMWIKNLGFPEYQNTFKTNFVTGRRLLMVDAKVLVNMNIKDFDHIKKITASIRQMFNVEMETLFRSISLPPLDVDTHFKLYKVPIGPVHDLCQRTDFLKKFKFMRELEVPLNHFEKLHRWLQHIPDFQSIRIGRIKRINLYFVKPNPYRDLEVYHEPQTCKCDMPPCVCNWTKNQKRKSWRLSFLDDIDEGKYNSGPCGDRNEVNFIVFNDNFDD